MYAPEGVCNCPPFVMATLAELAEHGIVGSADALPMPVREEPQEDPVAAGRRLDLLSLMDEHAASVVSPVLAAVLDEAERLRARVAELEAKAATARTEAIADVGDWLDEHGEKNAAHLVYTCDIPAARDMVTHVVADDSDDPEHVDDCPGCKTQQTGGAE